MAADAVIEIEAALKPGGHIPSILTMDSTSFGHDFLLASSTTDSSSNEDESSDSSSDENIDFFEFLRRLSSPLHKACEDGNYNEVLKLLSDEDNEGVDINATDRTNSTPLYCACKGGDERIVKLLIQKCAGCPTSSLSGIEEVPIPDDPDVQSKVKEYINRTDNLKHTPLGIACIKGNTEIVELLLEHGANFNVTDNNVRTPLGCACVEGHTEIVELLLKYGANVNVTDNNGNTPLGNASIPGHKKVVELLLEQDGVDINHINKQKCTPLLIACYKGYTEIVKLLLKHGADVTITDTDNDMPLGCACIKGHTEIVKLLLEHGADVSKSVSHTNNNGRTPLGCACIPGHTEIVELLLEHGADVNVTDNNGNTPLGNASIPGRIKVVTKLLEHGVDNVNHPNRQKRTPLGCACIEGHTEVVELLLKHDKVNINVTDNNERTPLGCACIPGHLKLVELLLTHGADVTITDNSGNTPLGIACYQGHTEIVELLLKHGADFNAADDDKDTPLSNACIKGRTKIVELLLEQDGVNINCTNDENNTPLVIACKKRHTEVVEVLLKHDKVNINVTDNNERTPLGIACEKGHTEIVKLLLKQDGVNVNATDKNRDTPLGIACKEGHIEIVKLLLEHRNNTNYTVKEHRRVDIDHANAANLTPLVLGRISGHTEIVDLLLEHGANVNVRDESGHTLLYNACKEGREQVVQLLLEHEADIHVTYEKKRNALHIACEQGHVEVVKQLLEHKVDVTLCDDDGLNALDIAVEKGKKDTAMVIVNSDKWKDALCNYTVVNRSDGVNSSVFGKFRRIWCCKGKESSKTSNDSSNHSADPSNSSADPSNSSADPSNDSDGPGRDDANKSISFTTPMRRIIQKMPDVAEAVFKKCCECDENISRDHPDLEVTFRFDFLDDFDLNHRLPSEEHNDQSGETNAQYEKWPPPSKYMYSSENHCLHILANSPSKDLLKHPLATALLDKKWSIIGRKFYYSNLFFYFLFVLLLTSFALTVHSPNSSLCTEVLGNDTDTFIDCFSGKSFVSQRYIPFASVCLIIYSTIMILREAFQLIQFRLQYFTSFVNYIEVSLFIFTIMFTSLRSNQCYCTHSWQWQIGVIAVFLSWIALIISIRKLPVVGIYVVMFIKIFNNFIKVVVLALLLISAFAIPLYMMFYDPQDRAEGIRTPFITPWRTIIKTIIMTEGEYDMDSILRQNNQRNASDIQYPVVSFSLIIVFVVLMPILFLNLLTGLAVGDTQEIQKSADTYRLILRVEFTLPIEEFILKLLSTRLPKKVKNSLSSWKTNLTKVKEVKYPNKKKPALKQIIDDIEKSVTTDQATVDDVKKQVKPLSEKMKNLRSSVTQEVKNQCSSVSKEVKTLRSSVSEEVKALRSSVSEEVKDLRSSMDQLLAIVKSMNVSINERLGGEGAAAIEEGETEEGGGQKAGGTVEGEIGGLKGEVKKK